MTVRVAAFAGEFAALAAWTGESEDQLRAEADADREHWLAWDGTDVVGAVHPWRSPDGRLRLYFDRCRPDALVPLAAAIAGECFATFDRDDEAALAAMSAAGFAEVRRENAYKIPVLRVDAPVPAGIRIVSADRTELEPLALLDCMLRDDVPGADGWQPDLIWFREETYDSPFFDPLTYQVALAGDRYVGLARIWPGPRPTPHLGLIGVLPEYRRRGLARALIAAAFAPLADRGVPGVTAEADATNKPSAALLTALGGRVTGGSIEVRRRSGRRLPPLPRPAGPLTPEQMAQRAVGDRPPEVTRPITVSGYDPGWPARYRREENRIRAALGERALAVDHVGSTAVPGLAAKDRVDIDLIVADPSREEDYVPDLAAAGYTLRTREPHWYGHRCLWTADHDASLHVFGPDCDEYLRHLIFRDWLRTHPADRDRYAARKYEVAAEHPMSMARYVAGKAAVIVEILGRAGLH